MDNIRQRNLYNNGENLKDKGTNRDGILLMALTKASADNYLTNI